MCLQDSLALEHSLKTGLCAGNDLALLPALFDEPVVQEIIAIAMPLILKEPFESAHLLPLRAFFGAFFTGAFGLTPYLITLTPVRKFVLLEPPGWGILPRTAPPDLDLSTWAGPRRLTALPLDAFLGISFLHPAARTIHPK